MTDLQAVGGGAGPPGGEVLVGDSREDSLRLLNDRPIDQAAFDLLGLDAYAGALEYLIAGEVSATPITIAVHAPWGSGKSSLARLLQARLERSEEPQRPHLVCWFNAWDHLVAAEPRGALVAAVARTASSGRGVVRRLLRPLPSRLLDPAGRRRRRTWYVLAALTVVGAVAAMAAWVARGDAADGPTWPTILATTLAALAAMKAVADGFFPYWSSLSGFVRDAPEVAASGSLGEVKDRLRKLVRSATRRTVSHPWERRLVVIVDDLDRCPADVALSLTSSCAQLLSVEGLVVVLLGDFAALEAQAAMQFGTTPAGSIDPEVGRRYVEKIIQYRVDLPQPRDDQVRLLSSPERLTTAAPSRNRSERRARSGPLAAFRALDRPSQGLLVVLAALVVLLLSLASLDPHRGTWWTAATSVTLVTLAWFYGLRTREARGRYEGAVKEAIAAQVLEGGRDSDAIAATVSAGLDQRGRKLWPVSSITVLAANAVARTYVAAIVHDPAKPTGGFAARVQAFADDASNNPRQRKRVVNQMILAFLIADRRGLLANPTEQVTEQVAKWSVLGTRWPKVREQICRAPDDFIAEEARLRNPALPSPPCDVALARFIRSDPALGPAVHGLITMSAWAPAGSQHGEGRAAQAVR